MALTHQSASMLGSCGRPGARGDGWLRGSGVALPAPAQRHSPATAAAGEHPRQRMMHVPTWDSTSSMAPTMIVICHCAQNPEPTFVATVLMAIEPVMLWRGQEGRKRKSR